MDSEPPTYPTSSTYLSTVPGAPRACSPPKLEDNTTTNTTTNSVGSAVPTAHYAAQAIILARDHGLSRVLKSAFYTLVKQPTLGVHGESDRDNENDAISVVDHLDLVRHGQKKIFKTWLDSSLFPPLRCSALLPTKACFSNEVAKQHWDLVTEPGLLQAYMFDAIGGLQKLLDTDWGRIGYCSLCTVHRKTLLRREQRKYRGGV